MKKSPRPLQPASGGRAPNQGLGKEAVAWAVASGRGDDLTQRIERLVKRHRRQRLVTTAVCLTSLFVAWATWHWHSASFESSSSPLPSSIAVSNPKKQVLPDGSEVELKEGAVISVEYGPSSRRVALRSGEAHFSVMADPARPFVVSAGGVEVRAVGTAFAVQLGSYAVEVLVTAGTVAVDQPADAAAPASAPAAVAEAGSRVVVELSPSPAAAAPQVSAVSEAELNDRLLWRVPMIEFSKAPLAEVIPIINRHNRAQLKLDPALGRLQMSGILRVDNTDLLLRLLRNEFGIEAEHRDADEIHLGLR